MRSFKALIIFTLVLLTIACNEVDPLLLPQSSDIEAIEIYEGVLQERKQVQVITDPRAIEDIIGFVKTNNSGWHTTWHTYPTPQATAVFRGNEKGTEMLLWFGPDWVGGHAAPISPKKAYLWGLSASKLQELKSKLGISI
ncbi:hypothetical protein [Microbulbifer sp. JMSA003]|uniref:hypothetical protein n=1 Tax=Microbulbifer sp. JMSA003 TaxID=3243369 RepID=UPI00403A5906